MRPEQAEAYRLFLRAYDACTALDAAIGPLDDDEARWDMNDVLCLLVRLQGRLVAARGAVAQAAAARQPGPDDGEPGAP